MILEARGLSKRFGALAATDGVSLDLRPGEIHALIGPNGAGKSTLISLLSGTLTPDVGTVHLDGTDVTAWPPVARARAGLARSFQVSQLMPEMTVLQTVLLARLPERGVFGFLRPALSDRTLTEPAMAALERVGMAGDARSRVSSLSHGQRRRLEIAVALAMGARTFLLDEPMAGMGPDGSAALTGLLDGLRETAPILLVEHDMEAVFVLADRVSVLVSGRIVATGPPDAIRADAEVRRAYLGEAA